MIKTCVNCAHFHGCLGEEESFYHIHDYCDQWNCVITHNMESDVNSFLENYWADMCRAVPDALGVSDDFETGEAHCWMFYSNDKECDYLPDKILNQNKEDNRQIAIKTLENIFKTNQVYDLDGELVELDPEDKKRLLELYNKIKD